MFPPEDPTLLRDQEWIVDRATQFYIIQQIGVDAETLNPSARQQPIHDLWLEVNRLTTLSTDDFTAGIDNLDGAAITLGSERYGYASLLINDLSAAVTAFAEDLDAPIDPEHVIAPDADCEAFSDYDEAQSCYAANPEEQGTIGPDFDGLACEVFFEREASSAPESAEAPQVEQPAQAEQPVQVDEPVQAQPVEEPADSGCDPNHSP